MGQANRRARNKLPVLAVQMTVTWTLKPEFATLIDETHAKMREIDARVPASRSDFLLGVVMTGLNRLLADMAAKERKNRLVLTPDEAAQDHELPRYRGTR